MENCEYKNNIYFLMRSIKDYVFNFNLKSIEQEIIENLIVKFLFFCKRMYDE